MAGFDVTEILAEVADRGILRPCRFSLSCGLPPALSGLQGQLQGGDLIQGIGSTDTISLWCEQAVIPGAALEVQPVRRYGYGPVERKPFGVQYADAQVVMRADAQGMIYQFIHAWMCCALHYNYGDPTMTSRSGAVAGQHPYEVSYKDDYAQPVNITQYDESANPIIQVTLREAYPIFVGDAPVAWNARGDYSRFPVTFTYLSWFTTPRGPTAAANIQDSGNNSVNDTSSNPINDGTATV